MDPEQTFLRVHARVSGMLSQLLTQRIRTVLEYVYLFVAVALFALLVVMHTNFVQQPGCSSQLSGVEITEVQLVQIKINSAGLWSRNSADQNLVNNDRQELLPETLKVSDDNGDGFAVSAVNFVSTWTTSNAKRSKLNFKSWKGDKEILEHQIETAVGNSILKTVPVEMETKDYSNVQDTEGRRLWYTSDRESPKSSLFCIFSGWYTQLCSFWRNIKQFPSTAGSSWYNAGRDVLMDIPKSLKMLRLDFINSVVVQWLEKSSRAPDPTYLYTIEKGYFLLPDGAKSRHNIHTINVTIPAHHSCFGNRWQQLLINRFVGYDTILMNSLLNSPGPGYLYNFQTKEFFDLSYGPEPTNGPARFGALLELDFIAIPQLACKFFANRDYFVTKCSVLLMSLFVFFTTTMSVSFTLRETQSRMLKFTVQLQHHARHHLPTFQLIFVHVIESLVFVPIMIGILFFLFEFYDDQLLAFLVLTLVWLCELFTMISVRTPISMQFFPRFFLLYFLVFHIYFFSYAYGFSYLAFSTTAAFMQHLILFFWNRYEVPALQRFMRNRTRFEQEAGLQITSSTILTSTVHIARVNVRNPNPSIVSNDIGSGAETRSGSDLIEAAVANGPQQLAGGSLDSTEAALQLPESNPQQAGTAPSPNSVNPFGSLLLWILGGASTDVLVSFFSLFRDLRDQDHVYVEPHQDGNEPIT